MSDQDLRELPGIESLADEKLSNMAESTESIAPLAKKESEPQRDPIVARSTSAIILICTLLLVGSSVWALYDEAYGQRPWRGIQRQFVTRYSAYLKGIRKDAGKSEAEIKESAEYQQLEAAAKGGRRKNARPAQRN